MFELLTSMAELNPASSLESIKSAMVIHWVSFATSSVRHIDLLLPSLINPICTKNLTIFML